MAHAQRHGLQALGQHPGVERAQRRAGVAHQLLHRAVDELLRAQDGAAERAALAVDVLGGGVHDDVGAELERPLQQRGGEDVVDDDGARRPRAPVRRPRRRRRSPASGWTATRRTPPWWAPTAPAPLVQVGAVDEHGLDAPARQDLVEDHEAGAEQAAGGHHAVALRQQRAQGGEHGGHAGRRGEARLGALEQAQPLLERGHGRVAVARVDEAVVLAGEGGLGASAAVVDEARGQEQRLGGLVEARARSGRRERRAVSGCQRRCVRRLRSCPRLMTAARADPRRASRCRRGDRRRPGRPSKPSGTLYERSEARGRGRLGAPIRAHPRPAEEDQWAPALVAPPSTAASAARSSSTKSGLTGHRPETAATRTVTSGRPSRGGPGRRRRPTPPGAARRPARRLLVAGEHLPRLLAGSGHRHIPARVLRSQTRLRRAHEDAPALLAAEHLVGRRGLDAGRGRLAVSSIRQPSQRLALQRRGADALGAGADLVVERRQARGRARRRCRRARR